MKGAVLVLTSSPRMRGNCEDLAKVAAESILAAGGKAECMSLASRKIMPCTACDLCVARKAKYCVIHDDMDLLYEKVLAADSLLLISPVYWFSYSAQLKLFIDRLYGIWNWDNDFMKGKKVASILAYGDVDVYASGAVSAIASFGHMFEFLGAVNRGCAYGTAGDLGEALKNEAFLARVRQVAQSLV